ncbi:hypothetical protein [Nostoc sp. 'Peltigera malacea cyanobiont' DB3992]|uniref:hypothetical protein n=1 Tax=Nostoc sp. 'Peltigera malacea cyanobiont' DB3992 TaxID=1206980 RepID=UPI0015D4F375|nr:hypothetical protein [Nostoc sp. 'Peltigera malacea cyanobiont' DB3992]
MTNKVTVGEKIEIRQAEIKDVERIARLCEQLEYSVTNQQIEQRLTKIKNNDTHIMYVATLVRSLSPVGWVERSVTQQMISGK